MAKVIGKTDLIAKVAKEIRMPKSNVAEVVDEFLAQIGKNLRKYRDDDVVIRIMNFGSFKTSFVESRKGVSPLDPKKKMVFPSRYQIRFSSGQKLKDIVNEKEKAASAKKVTKASTKKKVEDEDDE